MLKRKRLKRLDQGACTGVADISIRRIEAQAGPAIATSRLCSVWQVALEKAGIQFTQEAARLRLKKKNRRCLKAWHRTLAVTLSARGIPDANFALETCNIPPGPLNGADQCKSVES